MFLTLLFLAACGQGYTDVSTDPGYNTDGTIDDGNTGSDETETVYLEAGKTATWNASTHKVEDIRDLENAQACLDDPANTCVLTPAQIDISIGDYTTDYSYNLGKFTFTGETTKDMEESTDFTGELDTVDGLEGIKLSCYDSGLDKSFTTKFEDFDGDMNNIEADGIAVGNDALYANGPLLTKDDENIAILTENGLYFAGHNGNVGDYYIECAFD